MRQFVLALCLAAVAAAAQAQNADDRFAPRRQTTSHVPTRANPSPVSALVKWLTQKTAAAPASKSAAAASRKPPQAPVAATPVATVEPRAVALHTQEPRPSEEPRRSTLGHGYHHCVEGERIISAFYSEGSHTASGARFNPDGMTAAHRTLPFGTRLMVINPRNGRSVTVTVNDRGPFVKGVTLDLARGAAQAIGLRGTGAVCMAKA